MKQVIIFTNATGGVSVCMPTGELPIEQVQAKDCPADSYIVDVASLPENADDFFDCWEQSKGVVSISLTKAKEHTKKRLRAERAPLLDAQDVLFQRALETGADLTDIVNEKNRLRDITSLVDTVDSLDGLRSLSAAKE